MNEGIGTSMTAEEIKAQELRKINELLEPQRGIMVNTIKNTARDAGTDLVNLYATIFSMDNNACFHNLELVKDPDLVYGLAIDMRNVLQMKDSEEKKTLIKSILKRMHEEIQKNSSV